MSLLGILLKKGSVDLGNKRKYNSWSTSPKVASRFGFADGLVMSSILNSDYVDLSEVVKSVSREIRPEEWPECEIIADTDCSRCGLEEIESFNVLTANVKWKKALLNLFRENDYSFPNKFPGRLRSFRFKGNRVYFYSDPYKIIRDFRLQPTDDCD